MTVEEALRIIDPMTRLEALAEVEYYGGLRGDLAVGNALYEASVLAAAALEKQIEKKPEKCIGRAWACSCGLIIKAGTRRTTTNYCHMCGQKIDWEAAKDED